MARFVSQPPRFQVPFNRPFTVGTELSYIAEAVEKSHLSASGPFTKRCTTWIEQTTGCARALLTHSCTGALEMAVLLADLEPGDEVIMPSFTFVSTASAFALRGVVPVFVDIRPDTLNLDERLVEAAITARTKAIAVVHYGGVACEMDALAKMADRCGLLLIEDAAHAVLSSYDDRPLGAIGDLGTLSFHETKNIISGEGGALLVRDEDLVARAEILLEKGTNRSSFIRGEVDRYTWVDLGSSYGASEITAAFLWGQLEQATEITRRRMEVWDAYHAAFADIEAAGLVRRPVVPDGCVHGAHLYYLLAPNRLIRDRMLERLISRGVHAVFHYVPLHSAPAGHRYTRAHGALDVTDDVSGRLLRLPMWVGLETEQIEHVVSEVTAVVEETATAVG
jgi:dTDP-4-amino-4,6-dideoxygalactose transaminase